MSDNQALKPLNPTEIALSGLNLIEASAGTGKTYNITALFLRALLEFRASPDELGIPNVLVVTFTEAATQELRERIRARLRAAVLAFAAGDCDPGDKVLSTLLRAHAPQDYPDIARYLTGQLRRFDEASISTIHGFCQRVLRENAFETGSLFDVELVTSDAGLLRDAVEDAWRQRLVSMEPRLAAWLAAKDVTPEGLAREAATILGKPGARCCPEWIAPLEADPAALEEAYRQLKECWKRNSQTMVADLLAAKAEGVFHGGSVLHRDPARACAEAGAFFATDAGLNGGSSKPMSQFMVRINNGMAPAAYILEFRELCQAFLDVAARCKAAENVMLVTFKQEFVREVAQRLETLKQERQQQTFDDLLNRLARALEDNEALARRLLARYPVALIDEFQDTDPVQYRIFERIYRVLGGRLFMIGDPKQAIYSFRGGDIFTYIQARQAVEREKAFTLGENRRSVNGLVAAVNHLFADKEGQSTFGHRDIPFSPVEAKGKVADHLTTLDGEPLAPFQLMPMPGGGKGAMSADRARRYIAERTAAEIAYLLNRGQAGRLLLNGRAVVPADFAVLVRRHHEGRLVRDALAALGIASVQHSQESVFDSDEARELELILRACADPRDEPALKAALATGIMGRTAAQVAEVHAGEAAWEQAFRQFLEYHARWREEGCAAMLQHLLFDRQPDGSLLARRLVSADAGERRLTNVLHLMELLQEITARRRLGMAGLIKWLARQRSPDLRTGDAQLLRLESDEELVKIVTVHTSKGLQYPIVFCPFLWSVPKAPTAPFSFHDENDRAALEMGSADLPDYKSVYDAHKDRAQEEARQEEMRILYVALTRAEYLCYTAFGATSKGYSRGSALARALGIVKGDDASTEAMVAALEAYAAAAPGTAVVAMERPAERFRPGAREVSLTASPFGGRVPTGYAIASYSGLMRRGPERELRGDEEVLPTPSGPRPHNFFGFPRGAAPGTFLHELLERMDFSAPDLEALKRRVQELAPRYGIDAGKWSDVVVQALPRVLEAPLDDQGLTLGAIKPADRLSELEFHFSLGPQIDDLATVLKRRGVRVEGWEHALGLLERAPAMGLMKGSIDLVFRSGGRYYLADYKGNHLGNSHRDYSPSILDEVMAREGYQLQCLIYTMALHRYLGRRLSGYRYAEHMGGAWYLFLRGMDRDHPGCGVWYGQPGEDLVLALDDYLVGVQQDAA